MHVRTILALLALALGLAVGTLAVVDTTGPNTGSLNINEDDPGWDCRTMGNHVCGTGTRPPLPTDAPTGLATLTTP